MHLLVAGKKYYKILNLSENTSNKEVKKKYKELAKKYHPDINKDKNAHKKFLQIKEAYEIIILPEKAIPKVKREPKPKSKYEKHRERSKEIYEKKQKRKEIEIEEFYQSLRSGWRRKIVYINLCLGVLFSFFLILDKNLPFKEHETRIHDVELRVYQSYNGHQVQRVTTEKNQVLYLADYSEINSLNKHPEVVLNESQIFHYPIQIKHNTSSKSKLISVHFTFMWGLKLVVFIFLCPFVILLFRKNYGWFVFFHYSTLFISSGLLLYFVFYKNSLFSIFHFLFSYQ